jgi:peptidoglycan/LPS O-acetylase OafA/YrhL
LRTVTQNYKNIAVLSTAKMDPHAIAGIDLLRGVFAFLVLLAHSWHEAIIAIYGDWFFPQHHPTTLIRALMENTLGDAFLWVMGFFVLSGFCIQRSVMTSQLRGNYSTGKYIKARLTRIYPLFLFGLCLATFAWYLNQVIAVPLGARQPFPWWTLLTTTFCL